MNQRAESRGAEEHGEDDDTEEGFKARMMQLYDLYGDWTGESEDDDGELAETQSDGSPVVAPSVALTTLAMFLVRVSKDLEVEDEQFDDIIRELRLAVAAQDTADEDTQQISTARGRDVA